MQTELATRTRKYSNPRQEASFKDWPCGRMATVDCEFWVETHQKRGERVFRRTRNRYGEWMKPKATVYASRWLIVDGDNDKTYLISKPLNYDFFTIMEANLQFSAGTLYPGDAGYDDVRALFEDVHAQEQISGDVGTRRASLNERNAEVRYQG